MSAQFNPYQAPATAGEAPVDLDALEKAGHGRRFVTFLLDYFFYSLLAFVCGFIAAMIGPAGIAVIQKWNGAIFSWSLFILYYTFFESMWGRTPAKFILGTKVLTDEGGKPGVGTILKRTLCRFIPFEPFSFFGERGWHDSISDTIVIRTR